MSERDELIACQRRFLSRTAHELRTPLTSLRGHVEELLDAAYAGDEQERRAAALAIKQATDQLVAIVDEALRAADPDAPENRINPPSA